MQGLFYSFGKIGDQKTSKILFIGWISSMINAIKNNAIAIFLVLFSTFNFFA